MKRSWSIRLSAISVGILFAFLLAELIFRFQPFVEIDGYAGQNPWHEIFHHGNGEFSVNEYGCQADEIPINVLLLGDSWIEDHFLSNTLGQAIANKSGKCVRAFNGGVSSYSPTLYMLKGRKAFKSNGPFDYIVVNIDETDIGDEWLRYRIPLVRDTSGKIVAVPYERDLKRKIWWNGSLWGEDSSFYSVRFLRFSFLHKIMMPMVEKLTYEEDYSSLMKYVFHPDAENIFKEEQQYFKDRLSEMAIELRTMTKNRNSVYITHHPHLRGLVPDVDGKQYLPIISGALQGLQEKLEVEVLDARNHVNQIHGKSLFDGTFEAGDPFSHLTSDGAKRYGKWIVGGMSME